LNKTLYVGNLPFSTTEEELREMFAAHGEVTSAKVITDRETGRSRGFAFVEMASGAEEAMRALDGNQFGGRPLRVNEAQERERGGRGGPRGGGGGGGGGGRY
jgi:RNA recognition motif-containing protein